MNTWISVHPLNCLLISVITLTSILYINIFTEEQNLSKMKSGLNRKLTYKKISHISNHAEWEREKIKLAQKTKYWTWIRESKI